MRVEKTKKSDIPSSQDALFHNRSLWLALSRAAHSIQQAKTVEDVYRAVGEQIKSLGGETTLLMVNDDRRSLSIAYTSFSPDLIRKAEKLTGLSLREYAILFSPDTIYGKAMNGGKTIFAHSTREALTEILPNSFHLFVKSLVSMFNLQHGVLCPLRVDDEILGLLKINWEFLSEDDLPAMDSFAGQIASGLRNVKLMQKLQSELAARKQAESALHESEARWQFALEGAGDGIWDWDVPSGQVYYSQRWKSMLGYDGHEIGNILGEWEKLIHPDDEERCRQALARHFANETPVYQSEHRLLCKDGTYKWILDRGKVIEWTDEGTPRRAIGIHTDITERKNAENALRASEEKSKSLYQMLRLMTDNLPDMVWAKDMNGRYIFVNKFLAEKILVAQDTEEPIGKTDLYFVERQKAEHPDDPNWHTFGDLCLVTDGIVHVTRHAQRFEEFGNVKGKFIFLDVYKAPFWDEQGTMIGTVGVARDVTLEKDLEEERRQTQEALAVSEAELRALFASMQDTVLVIDQNGIYRNIADTHPGKLYISPKEVIGKHLSDFFSAAQTQIFLNLIRQVLETHQTGQIEYQISSIDQSPWFEASISPMGTDATLWVARDITERKKIEAALVQSENAYRTLFEDMPIGLYRTLADGQIIEANPALVKMFGYPDRSVLLSKNAEELYTDPTAVTQFKEKILISGVLSAFEAEFRRYDRSKFWAEAYCHIIFDENGVPLCYEGSLINITERKIAEYELRLANASLESAHRELQQALAHEQILARTDGLTGLYNRRYFHKLSAREFSSAIRRQHPLTIILFDVDGFKQFNDTYGHDVGDKVLIQVAQTTASQVREVDVLARYGGDEFIILFPETSAQDAFQIAERIRKGVESTHIIAGDEVLSATISVGVAEIDHTSQSKSIEDIIRHADKALYMVKQNGSNHTVIFNLASDGDSKGNRVSF